MEDHENHEYQAPGPNDSRSPCPGLNVLANHGYLPRDGKDITPSQFIDAIYKGYNLTKFLGFILTHGGFLLIGKTFEGKMSLGDLYNDAIEHPMSLTRPDKGLDDDYTKISQKLIDSLLSEKDENNKLTRKSFARQYVKRRDQSLVENPNFHGLSYLRTYQVFGEYALTLNCFTETDNGRGQEIDANTLESFYKDEKLPKGWKKAENTISYLQVHNAASDLRQLTENLDEDKKKERKND